MRKITEARHWVTRKTTTPRSSSPTPIADAIPDALAAMLPKRTPAYIVERIQEAAKLRGNTN